MAKLWQGRAGRQSSYFACLLSRFTPLPPKGNIKEVEERKDKDKDKDENEEKGYHDEDNECWNEMENQNEDGIDGNKESGTRTKKYWLFARSTRKKEEEDENVHKTTIMTKTKIKVKRPKSREVKAEMKQAGQTSKKTETPTRTTTTTSRKEKDQQPVSHDELCAWTKLDK